MLPLATAQTYARKICDWLQPYAHRLVVAGSIRRERPHVADIDIVCIPKATEHKDMFGAVLSRENHLWTFLKKYVQGRASVSPLPGDQPVGILSGGETEGKQLILQLPRCQLDLWFADERTLATRLLCRTGSKEHNIWLAQRAEARHFHWNPYEGLKYIGRSGEEHLENDYLDLRYEEDIYHKLGLPMIAPADRELPWLRQHFPPGR